MDEKTIASASTDKPHDSFRHLIRASRELKTEVERLRDILSETRVTTERVPAININNPVPLTTHYRPSTFLIAVLLQALLEGNEQIDFLHKQLAANTKRLAELHELALKYNQQAKSLGKILNQIYAAVGFPTNDSEPRAVESVIARLVGVIRNLGQLKSRQRRRVRRSLKKRYRIR